LGEEGASVVISSRREKNVTKAVAALKAKNIKVHGTICHVASAEDRAKLFAEAKEKFGGIDILVSNAAVTPETGPVLDTSEKAWDKIFEVNVKASFMLAKEALPFLRERGGGNIVFISSIAGFHPNSILGAYGVSKTALFGLTKAAAGDLASEKIRVNCLAPGLIETKFSSIVSIRYYS
jgi:dehydrogenase/reductase SDR family member 4